jgi:3,4-dihydroxy 2-butanone 4-phosphate synthase/GTP cyclohydrolase II
MIEVPVQDGGQVHPVATTQLPTAHGVFAVHGFRDGRGEEHVALVLGAPQQLLADDGAAPLVRVHSECLTGDALGSWRCDCGDQLHAAQRAIAAEGRGVVVYLRGQEGRGIGLMAKLSAYALQDAGADTVDANTSLGLPVDARDYAAAAAVLRHLGLRRVRLLTSNPDKAAALRAGGVEVEQVVGVPVPVRTDSARYRQTKVQRMGHLPPVGPRWSGERAWKALLAASSHSGADDLAEDLPDAHADTDAAASVLLERYAPLATGRPLVIAQVAQSLDGFTAARTGDAHYVSGAQDREHLHRLRALVDAVVVGVSTVVADDPQLTVRACPGPHPVRVVLDPRARAPLGARVFTDAAAPVLWCTSSERAEAAAEGVAGRSHVQVVGIDVSPVVPAGALERSRVVTTVLRALSDRGLDRVLVEGGATTVSAFLAAGALDRLWVTTAPVLVGDGVPGLRFDGADLMADALRAPSRRFVLGDDVAVELDLAAARAASASGTS